MEKLAEILTKAREAKGYTLDELADKIGLTAKYRLSTIAAYEKNRRTPETDILIKLAQVLDLDDEELVALRFEGTAIAPYLRTSSGQPSETHESRAGYGIMEKFHRLFTGIPDWVKKECYESCQRIVSLWRKSKQPTEEEQGK